MVERVGMTEQWTITAQMLRTLYALDARGEKGMPTGSRNTNAAITYATAEALERRLLAKIAVDGGDYWVHVTDAGHEFAERMRAQGRR